MGQGKRHQSRRGRNFLVFFRDSFRLEVAGDVISGVAVRYVGMDIRVKFGESGSNPSRDIRAAQFVMDNDERKTAGGPCSQSINQNP